MVEGLDHEGIRKARQARRGLNRPCDGDGFAAGLVSGGEAHVEAVGDGGAGEGEAGDAAIGERAAGGDGGDDGLVLGGVVRAGGGAQLVVVQIRIGAGGPGEVGAVLGGVPLAAENHGVRGVAGQRGEAREGGHGDGIRSMEGLDAEAVLFHDAHGLVLEVVPLDAGGGDFTLGGGAGGEGGIQLAAHGGELDEGEAAKQQQGRGENGADGLGIHALPEVQHVVHGADEDVPPGAAVWHGGEAVEELVVREVRADAAVEFRHAVSGGAAELLEGDAGVLQIIEAGLEQGLGIVQIGPGLLEVCQGDEVLQPRDLDGGIGGGPVDDEFIHDGDVVAVGLDWHGCVSNGLSKWIRPWQVFSA